MILRDGVPVKAPSFLPVALIHARRRETSLTSRRYPAIQAGTDLTSDRSRAFPARFRYQLPPHTPRPSDRRRWTALEPHIGRALLEGSNLVSIPITKLPDSTSFARSRPEPPFCQRRYKERYRVFRTYSPYIPALSMPDYSCETVNLAVFRSMQPRLGSFWTIPRSHTKQ